MECHPTSVSAWIVVLAGIVACDGPGTFQGTVAGRGLVVKDSVAVLFRQGSGIRPGPSLGVAMADVENLCESIRANKSRRNATTFSMRLYRWDEQGQPTEITPGDYEVSPAASDTTYADVQFRQVNDRCSGELTGIAGGGRVNLTTFEARPGAHVRGSFAVIINFPILNEQVSGTFNAAFCDATPGTSPTCE